MKIAFEHQIFSLQKYGGISRYFTQLVAHLAKTQDVDVKIIAPLYVNEYAKYLSPTSVQGYHFPLIPKIGTRICSATNRMMTPLLLKQFQPDIVHATYYFPHVEAQKKAKRVTTVHDMIHERFPSMFPKEDPTAARKKKDVLDADHVICVSENTRRDLTELYELDPKKVSVVHHGYDVLNAGVGSGESASVLDKSMPFLLYVGARAFYKNFKTFLRAYASSVWLRENFRIICFGGGRFRADELELVRSLSIKPLKIEQISGGDEALAVLYKNAAAFVYPSLYEGFGFPTLEAMALGCPVICSNTSSIPEIVGDAGEYFDPEHIESIRTSLEAVLMSTEKQTKLIQKGLKKCAEYSWERCANETLAIYREIVK